MSRYKCVVFAMLTISVLLLGTSIGFAQDQLERDRLAAHHAVAAAGSDRTD